MTTAPAGTKIRTMTTPVREQIQWYVDAMEAAGRGEVNPAEIRSRWANPFDNTDEEERAWWTQQAARTGTLTVASVEEGSPHAAVFVIDEEKTGRSSKVTIEVEPEPPHRITLWRWRRNHPFELNIRQADPA